MNLQDRIFEDLTKISSPIPFSVEYQQSSVTGVHSYKILPEEVLHSDEVNRLFYDYTLKSIEYPDFDFSFTSGKNSFFEFKPTRSFYAQTAIKQEVLPSELPFFANFGNESISETHESLNTWVSAMLPTQMETCKVVQIPFTSVQSSSPSKGDRQELQAA